MPAEPDQPVTDLLRARRWCRVRATAPCGFGGNDRQELLRQVAFDEPPRPRRLHKAVPLELETIVLKAMEKRPQDRYNTAQEMADDLERWLRHEPIHARRPLHEGREAAA
jgi:hypothetical protein